MATLGTIALLALLIGFRLLCPPVPAFYQNYMQRWGKRTTLAACMVSIAGMAIVVFLSRG